MKRFHCHCGNELFFTNSLCCGCGRTVGYHPASASLLVLEPDGERWRSLLDQRRYRVCANRSGYGVCNGLVADEDASPLCLACRLNRTIPNLDQPINRARWARLEAAKRRLIFGLLDLGLPLEAPVAGYPRGLCFDFLADQRLDPQVEQRFVSTGHQDGVVTINLLEADEIQRVWQRERSSERYRTLLGHFRHEAGHYYYELLTQDRDAFIALYGDPALAYAPAMQAYYDNGPLPGWDEGHISAYASAHPLEDWAESFAHYLHMRDTLETAAAHGVLGAMGESSSIEALLQSWEGLTVILNELNRGLGLEDAYPFVVSPPVADKLRFVHAAVVGYEAGR